MSKCASHPFVCASRHRLTTHFTPGFFIFRLTPGKNLKLQMYLHTFSIHKHHTLLYLNMGGKFRLSQLFKATSTVQENSYSRPSWIRIQHIRSFLPAIAFFLIQALPQQQIKPSTDKQHQRCHYPQQTYIRDEYNCSTQKKKKLKIRY